MKTQANILPLQKEATRSVLDEIVREGAQKMLQMAVEVNDRADR